MCDTMRKFSNFLEFLRREADGSIWEDPTYRAYDLESWIMGEKSLTRARQYLGYFNVQELVSDLRGIGYKGPIHLPLLRYYVWHRLMTGILKKWPLRTKRENKPRNRNPAGTEQKGKST